MIITETPLRVSFAGGGTDIPAYYERRGGYVVNAAVDISVFVIVTARSDDKIYVNYSRKEIVEGVDAVQHELVRESLRVVGIDGGVEITLLSDIPSEGAGLGSSSSFTVGLLHALHHFRAEAIGPERLAEEACDVEIRRCAKPIGKQDQYVAAFGGVLALGFDPDGSVQVERLSLSAEDRRRLAACLLLFDSGQKRRADDILEEQRARTSSNLERLDAIKALAREARSALARGHFDCVGRLLDENWRLKRQLAGRITNDGLDEMHRRAMMAGAAGAKVCGAGGGGFLLVYCPPSSAQARLRAAMAQYREMPFELAPEGSRVIFDYRRPLRRMRP